VEGCYCVHSRFGISQAWVDLDFALIHHYRGMYLHPLCFSCSSVKGHTKIALRMKCQMRSEHKESSIVYEQSFL
jgi:hypothetical protein